jgi:hypothetical protein
MAFQETTWLDYIPGARTAYNYLISKGAEFYLVGTQKIPTWERTLGFLSPRVQASNDTGLRAQLTSVTKGTIDLKGGWSSLETRVTDMLSRLRAVGLGDGEGLGIAVAIPVALAVSLITLVGGLYIFFGSAARNETAIRKLCTDSVARGIISERECAGLLREGTGDPLGLKNLALFGGFALAAILILRSRRAA